MYRSRNPTLSDSTFDKSNYQEATWWNEDSNLMTMEGTVEKTGILLILTATLAIATYASFPSLYIIGFLGGFITAMIVIFSRSTNPVLICGYAVFEGIALGGFTYFVEISV
ncbi:MAG: Bax inhibitor-1/YccA family membrane protein, partial [Candidatus Thalassarchaeaceae archaeon]